MSEIQIWKVDVLKFKFFSLAAFQLALYSSYVNFGLKILEQFASFVVKQPWFWLFVKNFYDFRYSFEGYH